MEIKNAEYAAIKTSDVKYDVNITIRPDVFFNTSGWPVTHEQIRLFNPAKGTVPGSGRADRLYISYVAKQFNTRMPKSQLTV